MNVPNRYKGFSRLPENVQQKMDPSLARKYEMGGPVMQRPLFRQMGGPSMPMPQDMAAPPPPMPPGMMAPPPPPAADMGIAALQEAEMSGEQMGMRAADQTMQNIDGAQDYEALIDGIRGNQMPIEARYQELAGMVGEQDAMATPESVLTLTQPTIMLTEQGAMDSGIGELIQGLSGETEMSGPMEEGVGSLMAAGAGNTPPVNFRDGGPVEVRNFKNGTPAEGNLAARTKSLYPQMKDLYAGILGDPAERAAQLDEQKRLTQAQMLFDIAGTALNFAGNTQGSTAAERLANAASQTQLFDKIGQRAAGQLQAKQAQKAEERQLNMAALTGAIGESTRQLTAEEARALAAVKKTASTSKFETLYLVNEEGNLTGQGTRYNLTNPLSLTAFNAALATGKYRDATTAAPFLEALGEEIKPQELTQVRVTSPITIDNYTYKIGEIANLTPRQKQINARKWDVVPENVEFKTLYNGSETKLVITNAPGAVKTLTELSKQGWSESEVDAKTAAKKEIISFTKYFDKKAQERLFKNQKELAALKDKTTRRGQDLQKEIAADANALRLTIQANDQVFTEGRDQSLQGYKIDLRNLGSDLDQQLQAIKGQQGTEIEQLRSDLRKQNDTVKAELSLANQLQVAGVKNVYEIEKLSTQNERDKELLKLRNALDDVSRKDQNVFTASESLLTRVAQKENNLLRINASSALQNEAQNFKLAENEKDRVLKASESALARVADLNLQIGSQAHNQAMQQARLDVTQSEGLNNREASALESALNRTLRETLQFNSQEFKAVQSEIEREFNLTESEKKALATLNQNIISNAMEEDRLNLQKARDVVNATSTEAKTALDRERLELQKIVELTITDKDVFKKFGIPSLEEFEKLPEADRRIMLGYPPRYLVKKVSTDVGTKLVRINLDDPTDVVDLATYDPIAEGKFYNFTYKKDGKTVTTLQDLSTPVGKKLMQLVNSQNAKVLGSAGMLKVGTENLTPQSYITDKANGSQVITSYDNRTFVDPSDGEVKLLTEANAVGLRDSNVYEIMKKSQLGEFAEKQLKEILGVSNLDEVDVYVDENGNPLPEEEQTSLRQMIDKELKYLSGVKTTLGDVKKGTGLVSNFYALLNNVGGPFFPETFDRIFGEFAEARSSIARFNILAISAMSVNPGLRVSNMEMDKVKGILPDPARIFTNVESEAKRFKKTINLLRQQRLILLQAIEAKDPLAIGKDTSKATFGKLREINKILSLVRAGNGDAGMSLDNALKATDEID